MLRPASCLLKSSTQPTSSSPPQQQLRSKFRVIIQGIFRIICCTNNLVLLGSFNEKDIQATINAEAAEYCSLGAGYSYRHGQEIKANRTAD